MAEQLFAIVFRGRLQTGADPAEVRANFARLFNIDAARVEQMFAGQAVIIKKGLDLLAADKYKAALAKAGAVVEAIDMPADGAVSAPAVPAALSTKPATHVVQPKAVAPPATPAPLAQVASPVAASHTPDPSLARDAPPAALRGTPSALDTTLAEPGVVLVEATHIAAAAIATEHLSLAEAGVRIVDYTPPPAPQFDLAAMTLAEPGAILIEPHKPSAPQFDLSGLSLDESARP